MTKSSNQSYNIQMYSWAALGLLITIAYALLFILKWRIGRNLRHLPTYTYLPIVGNMHYLIGGGQNAFQRLIEVSDLMEKANLPFVFWVGIHPIIVISDPDDAKMVSNAFIEKPHFYNFLWLWLGNGLLTAPGYIWRKNIKMLGGAFTREVVNSYQEMFNAQAKKLVQNLKLQVDRSSFDVMRLLSFTTLESICQTALGVSEITNSISIEDYHRAFNNTLEKLIQRAFNIFLHPECVYKHTSGYKEYEEHVAVLQNMSETVLKKRKQQSAQENKNVSDDHEEISRPGFKAYIDSLLNTNSLTEHQIKSELNTIIFGGQETVATTLFFVFSVIGSKKDVQDKLFDEIKEIFGDSKRDVLKEDLNRMVYCEAVIYEALRLYPPVLLVLRKVERDLKLKSCTIPKGATCLFNAWGSGRSKRQWGPDALDFNPERWSGPTPPIMTFGIGRRACIGKRYAIPIMKTILAHCIRELVFTSDAEKMELTLGVTLSACQGNLMQVKLREEK